MSEFEFKVDITFKCICGFILEARAGVNLFDPDFRVIPCPECMRVARNKGYADGYENRQTGEV